MGSRDPGGVVALRLQERQVRLARDDVVCQPHYCLLLRLKTHLRPTEDDGDVRADAFDQRNHFRRGRNVPDINAKPNDLRIMREQTFRGVERALIDVELCEQGMGL